MLLASPQERVGSLFETSGQFIEVQTLHLVDSPPPLPRVVWSSLMLDEKSRQPVQILTLTRPPQIRRLANVRCLGYFYKVRQDQAQKPDRSGQWAAVQVPVLVGWLWLGTEEPPAGRIATTSTFAKYVVPAILGAVFLVFLLVAMASRQRTDWRTRIERRRSWKHRRDELRGQTTDDSETHDEQ